MSENSGNDPQNNTSKRSMEQNLNNPVEPAVVDSSSQSTVAQQQSPPDQPQPASSKELMLGLVINVVIPVVILRYFSKPEYLGIKLGLVIALAFPIIYGCKVFIETKKISFFAVAGVIGVLTLVLTVGMGLLEIDPKYIAIKEAAVPGILGIAVFISVFTRYPLFEALVLKNPMLDLQRINHKLEENNSQRAFKNSLKRATLIFASSFFLSAVLNYVLAIVILVSPTGTEQFNEELSSMIALSYPVIVLPAFIVTVVAFVYTLRSIKKYTSLGLEEIFLISEE